MSRLEYMRADASFRFTDAKALEEFQSHSPPDEHLGKVVVGLACCYEEIHRYKGQFEIFSPDCFEQSLKSLPVDLRLWHDPQQKITDTTDRIELFNDKCGLWFRFFPSTAAKHQQVAAGVGQGELSGASVGYTVQSDSYLKRRGMDVRVIQEATLVEISLGRDPVVKSAGVLLVDGAEMRQSLVEETKDGALRELRSRAISDVWW